MIFRKPAPTVLFPILSASTPAKMDVVFIHGLGGDPRKTWRFESTPSWQVWMSDALPEANIWSLGYNLTSSWWNGGSLPLTDRAINVLATLSVELKQNHPIVFICHSYGGLLAKQILRTSREISPEYRDFISRVKGIVFFGTPHTGSGLASYSLALRSILRSSPAIDELKSNSALLRELNTWFRRSMTDHPLSISVYYETQPTRGLRVVDEASSDPGIAFVTPVPVDADHVTLPKPLTPDFRVKQTIALLHEILRPAVHEEIRNWIAEILSASDDRLRFIQAELKHALSQRPDDLDALRGQAFLAKIQRESFGLIPPETLPCLPPSYPTTSNGGLIKYLGIIGIFGLIPTILLHFNATLNWILELFHFVANLLKYIFL